MFEKQWQQDGLTEFEQDLLKSFGELNDDIDRNTEALEDELDDFGPEGFLKGVHEDNWKDEEDEDEDFDLEDEGDEDEDEDEDVDEEIKKKKRSKFRKDSPTGGVDTFSGLGPSGLHPLAKSLRGFRIKTDPFLKKLAHNQAVMGHLLKSLCETVSPGMRQIANLAEWQGFLPRSMQDRGQIGGQVNPTSAMPRELTKAVEEVGFIGDEKQREAAIDVAFAKGLLPDGLTDSGASALYREDHATFVRTVAPVLVQMRRDGIG